MNSDLGFHLIGLSLRPHLRAMLELAREAKRLSRLDHDPWSSLNGWHLVETELDQSRGELPRLRPNR